MIAAICFLLLQDPFPEPGKISKRLTATENCYNLLVARPAYSDIPTADGRAPGELEELYERLTKLRQFGVDAIESGMITVVERAEPGQLWSTLNTLDVADEVVLNVPENLCLHLYRDSKGRFRLHPFVPVRSGRPLQPITRFRELKRLYHLR